MIRYFVPYSDTAYMRNRILPAFTLDYLNPFHCFNPSTIDHKGPGGSPRRIIEAMQLYVSGQVDHIPWSGVHVLFRVLTRDVNRLVQEPEPEVESLRGKHTHQSGVRIRPGASGLLPGIRVMRSRF